MKNSTRYLLCMTLASGIMLLSTTGCATRRYVRKQVAETNVKVSALEAKNNELANKEQTDISRVEEKIATTDSKVAELSTGVQSASAAADKANQLEAQNQAAIAANASAMAAMANAKPGSYSLVAKADVTFAFNKYMLGQVDEAALDALIQQSQSKPTTIFELIGFTDEVGSKDYNLILSRRRAESVARYMVRSGVPLHRISIIGLGKEAAPASLVADLKAVDPNAPKSDSRELARRVLIRVYSTEPTPTASASLQQ